MCFYQVISGEGLSDHFEDWLANELEYIRMRASCAVPEDFPKDDVWNWEVCFFILFLYPKFCIITCLTLFLSDYFSFKFITSVLVLSLMKNSKDTFLPT